MQMQLRVYVPQPNWELNAAGSVRQAFGIFMAYVSALRTLCSGAG